MDGIGKRTLDTLSQAEWYNRWLFSLMEPYVKGEILEVGVGIGNFTDFLIKKGLSLNTKLEEAISDLLFKNGTILCTDSPNFYSG